MKDSPESAVRSPGQDPDLPEVSEAIEPTEVPELIDAPEGDDVDPADPLSADADAGADADGTTEAEAPVESEVTEGAAEVGEAQPEDESACADDAPPEEDSATDEELVAQVSALLFASPDPLGAARLATVLGTSRARVKVALAQVGERLTQAGLGFELRGLAGGSTFMTQPGLGELVASLSKQAAVERISPAALETLSVVAYRGPVTKAEIEAIRGVQAGPMLRSLVDRGLVKVVGRSEDPGHALMYGTTKDFLFRFGLETLADLPRDGELARN